MHSYQITVKATGRSFQLEAAGQRSAEKAARRAMREVGSKLRAITVNRID